MHYLITLLFCYPLIAQAQSVHIHELSSEVKASPVSGAQIHSYDADQIHQELAFQKKVFAGAQLEAKVAKLDSEEREDLLEAIEGNDVKNFIVKYPQFTITEAEKLKRALYE